MSESRFKQTLRRLGDDDRAVSPVVGFVLMFALVMLIFTLYQSSVVPAQNEEVEFEHSQVVEGEMSQLNDALADVAAGGAPTSVTVSTGMQYPDRVLAVNPGNPAGTISTSDPGDVTLSGLEGDNDYWEGDRTFTDATRLLSYTPSYNRMQQEATYHLEYGVYAEAYDSGNTLINSKGSLFANDGERINLLLIGGDYSETSLSASVTAQPVSTSTEYRTLTATGSDSSIKLPTELSADAWQTILDGKDDVSFEGINGGRVVIGLTNGEDYSLRITKVGLGGADEPGLAYLENESDLVRNSTLDTTEDLTVSARDTFGNRYTRGADVEATVASGSGTFAQSGSDTASATTDDNGQTTFRYEPSDEDAGSTVEVELKLTEDGSTIDTATYEITYPETSEDDNSSNTDEDILGSGDITNGWGLDPSIVTIDDATAATGIGAPISFVFHNRGGTSMTATEIQMNGVIGMDQRPVTEGDFNGEPIQLNGRDVNLTDEPGVGGDTDNTFTIDPGEEETVQLTDHDGQVNEAGFLIVSVRYQYTYTDGGEEKTGTAIATYAVPVNSG